MNESPIAVAGRVKGKLRVVAVNILIFLVGLLLLELCFGNWFFENKMNNLNLIRSQTIKYKLNGLYGDPGDISIYRRDKYGLRGNYSTVKEIELLTVGGSTTDQRYISEGQTWQDVLQDSFKSEGKSLVVANAGVDGQTTYGHIKNFDYWFPHVPNLHPKYVLFYIGLNDFHMDEGYGADRLRMDDDGTLVSQVRKKSALYRLLRTLYGVYYAEVKQNIGHGKIDVSTFSYTRRPLQSDYSFMNKRLSEYRDRLTVLVDKTKSFGAKPIIVTQPQRKYRFVDGVLEGIEKNTSYDGYQINGVDYYRMKAKLDSVALEVCRAKGIVCIEMGQEKIWGDSDFYDFAHMTASGARKVGKYLFNELKAKI